jgi:hypothetical protein
MRILLAKRQKVQIFLRKIPADQENFFENKKRLVTVEISI